MRRLEPPFGVHVATSHHESRGAGVAGVERSSAINRHQPRRERLPGALGAALLLAAMGGLCAADVHVPPKDIADLLEKHCLSCHGPTKAKGDVRLDQLPRVADTTLGVETWMMVRRALVTGDMPPAEAKSRPDVGQRATMVRWVDQQLAAPDSALSSAAARNGSGNLIPHEQLFGTVASAGGAGGEARLWRITPKALEALIRRVCDHYVEFRDGSPFELDAPGNGFRDFANRYDIDLPTADRVADWALLAVRFQTEVELKHGKLVRVDGRKLAPELAAVLAPDAKPTEATHGAALRFQFITLLRREPAAAELPPLLGLITKVDRQLGHPHGLRAALAAVVLSPEALFRYEGVDATPAANGTVRLRGRELADALSFALGDVAADDGLRKAFSGGGDLRPLLATEARKQIFGRGRAKDKMVRFFLEFFEIEQAVNVFKDKKDFKYHYPEELVKDTTDLIRLILEEDRDVIRELLTTERSYVNYGKEKPRRDKEKIWISYGLPEDWTYTREQPLRLNDGRHAGILTQPAWLAAFSANTHNDPIRRGRWIRTKLLGGAVPALPVNVDAKLPDDPALTLRQKLHVTSASECWKCHKQMNDLGLPFESFDHFGRPRSEELGKPVITTGEIAASGEAGLDAEIKDPVDLAKRLGDSVRVRQMVVRHAFRFFLGRNETVADAASLQAADQAYVGSGGSFRALVLALITSPAMDERLVAKAGPTSAPASVKKSR